MLKKKKKKKKKINLIYEKVRRPLQRPDGHPTEKLIKNIQPKNYIKKQTNEAPKLNFKNTTLTTHNTLPSHEKKTPTPHTHPTLRARRSVSPHKTNLHITKYKNKSQKMKYTL